MYSITTPNTNYLIGQYKPITMETTSQLAIFKLTLIKFGKEAAVGLLMIRNFICLYSIKAGAPEELGAKRINNKDQYKNKYTPL